MNIELLEKELKKRWKENYYWGRKQADCLDFKTNFIYNTSSYELLLDRINSNFKELDQFEDLKNYTLNRWYNFWSAKGIESLFCEHEIVKPHAYGKDKLIDFYIDKLPFDHKTSVFPKGFMNSVPYAIEYKRELISWLYTNQSQQQRKHFRNRLFIVLVDSNGHSKHWKLKAELSWLKNIISTYLVNFDRSKLERFTFENKEVYSDIVWAIK